MTQLVHPLTDRPVASPYVHDGRWSAIEEVGSTGWESLGHFELSAEQHDAYLATFSHPARSRTGEPISIGVLGCLLLGSLRNSFPLPDVPESEGPTVLVHSNQVVRVENPAAIGSRLHLLGRLTAQPEKRAYLYEGWLLDENAVPMVFSSFYIRVLPVERMAAQ